MTSQIETKEFEFINAYLDHEMTDQELLSFATRLAENHELKDELNELIQVKQRVRTLPQRKPPRNYTLTRAEAAAIRKPGWLERLFPAFRTAAVFACLGLIFSFLLPWMGVTPNQNADSVAYMQKSVEGLIVTPPSVAKEQSLMNDQGAQAAVPSLKEIGISSTPVHQPSQGFRGGSPKFEYLVSVERVKPDAYLDLSTFSSETAIESTALSRCA